MQRILVLPVAIVLTLLLSAITVVFAIDDQSQKAPIDEKQVDVTGDGKNDLILLKGIPLEKNSKLLKVISLTLKTSEGDSHKLKLDSGFKPKMKMKDFNHDGVNDVLIRVHTDESGDLSDSYLYSFNGSKKKDLTVPESLSIGSQFEDNYLATIKINETGEAYTFNLKDRKAKYDKLGLFNEGKLNEPMELTVLSYSSLKPVKIAGERLGLKGIQEICGVSDGDPIGYVESTWLYEQDSWKLLNTSVHREKDTKKNK